MTPQTAPEPVLSDSVVRRLEKRAAVLGDDVARLKLVRQSLAVHEARKQRDLQHSIAARSRKSLAIRIAAVTLMPVFTLAPRPPRAMPLRTVIETPLASAPAPFLTEAAPRNVWLVETRGPVETYSNGLRVDNEFLVRTKERCYRPFDPVSWRAVNAANQPAGIVYHTTESGMSPFDPGHNTRLQRNGQNLLAFVAKNRLYHFVIDRFGRVFRVVAEADYANHAGHSVWAGSRAVYWGLNQSFLGVAFEAQTDAQSADAADIATPAQIDAARVLTEMLRYKYNIPAGDCVTHAQVSVNLDTLRLGYHTDWAANFPFREVGLGDGYSRPVMALALFGFDYDSAFLEANGRKVWAGLVTAEEQLLRDAAAHGTTPALYRRWLQRKFRAFQSSGAAEQSAGEGDR